MQFLSTVISALLAISQALGVTVNFDTDGLVVNEANLPVSISVKDLTLGAGEVSGLRTTLFVPHKRGPKFVGNYTHDNYAIESDGVVSLDVTYSLPTKTYLLGYSVQLIYESGNQEWIDSELKEVKVVDPTPNTVSIFASLLVLLGGLYGLAALTYRLSTPGFWERTLPSYLNGILPKDPKQKRA